MEKINLVWKFEKIGNIQKILFISLIILSAILGTYGISQNNETLIGGCSQKNSPYLPQSNDEFRAITYCDGGDLFIGRLSTSSFYSDNHLSFSYSGYPQEDKIDVFVVNSSGDIYPLKLKNAGEKWLYIDILLPMEYQGKRIKVVAVDSSKNYKGWVGIGHFVKTTHTSIFSIIKTLFIIFLVFCLFLLFLSLRKRYLSIPIEDINKKLKFISIFENIVILIVVSFFTFFFGRYIVSYDLPLNPDEAAFTASALRILSTGWNWDSVDLLSSGPFNAIILIWPSLMGLDITLATTRITSLGLSIISFFFVYLALKKFSGFYIAILSSVIIISFYSTTLTEDFAHYSSEKFPIALLSIVLYLIADFYFSKERNSNQKIKLRIAMLILGFITYLKLQSILLVLTFISIIFLMAFFSKISLDKKIKEASWLVFFLLIPSVIILLPLYLNGTFSDFYKNYLLWALQYVKQPSTLSDYINATGYDEQFDRFFNLYFLISMVSYFVYLILKNKKNQRNIILISTSIIIFLVSYNTVIAPGYLFLHYFNFNIPFLVLAFGIAITIVYKELRSYPYYLSFLYLFIVSFFIFILNLSMYGQYMNQHVNLKHDGYKNTNKSIFQKNNFLDFLLPEKNKDYLLVWGWMGQYSYESNLSPATRSPISQNQIQDFGMRPYFRKQFIDDFNKTKPNYVIDAVSPRMFAYTNYKLQSISSFPSLSKIVSTNYIKITPDKKDNICPRIYVKKNKYNEILRTLIQPKIISSSIITPVDISEQNLNDNSIFETCTDSWVLPVGTLGSVSFQFNPAEIIDYILILNTKGGKAGNYRTKEIKITFYNNGKVLNEEIYTLKKFPRWTKLMVNNIQKIDNFKIEILSFIGTGAGLNEVKIYRQ